MKKVLITQPIHEEAVRLLEGRADIVVAPDPSEETVASLAGDVHGIVVRTTTRITADVIASARELEVIARTGAGVDNVDVAAATARGIPVCNLPGVNAGSVAEHTVALILALAKDLRRTDAAVRAGNWAVRNDYRARDLAGKTLGLVGLGRIGRRVAGMCSTAFGMRAIGCDPFVGDGVPGVEMHDGLADVFRESDFVSVHVPYTQETHHLVGGELLRAMKSDACFINTSRGSVVDEVALIAVLGEGAIAGAGLDVLEEEPPSRDNPLLGMDNVVLTAHSASLTRECVIRQATGAARAVLDVFAGREPEHVFNRESLQNRGKR